MASLAYGYGEAAPSHELLRQANARLQQTGIAQIFEFGLHEFITQFINTNRQIADAIAADYRFTE
jgi:uncharacterized alpha-E superfamily protein